MTRITQVPGGQSSIVFGDNTPASPNGRVPASTLPREPTAQPKPPAPISLPPDSTATNGNATAVAGTPAVPVPTAHLEGIKLKAITALSQLQSLTPQAEELITSFLQESMCSIIAHHLMIASSNSEKQSEGRWDNESLSSTGCKTTAAVDADEAREKLKATLKQRGTHGILSLGKKFKSMDDDGNNKLSFEEFHKAMLEMQLSEADVHRLFRHFDADCNGYIAYDELLRGLRGSLNPARLEMVQLAFKVADKTGDAQLTLEDFRTRYDASRHPDVMLGVKTTDQVMSEVMEVFEAQGGGTKGDGIITVDEFRRYYEAVSASIDSDDYFELVIQNAWHISGGLGWCANTTCKRVLVLHEDGSQSVQEVQDDLDIDSSQYLQKLKDQGVANIKSIALYGEPSSVPSGQAAQPPSPVPSTPSGRYAQRKPGGADHFRSSIRFG